MSREYTIGNLKSKNILQLSIFVPWSTDIEFLWNEKFYKDFEIKVDCPNNGFLQDVHWAAGLFGYFPTYTLGALYAAQLFSELKKKIPNLSNQISKGNFDNLIKWLRKNWQLTNQKN